MEPENNASQDQMLDQALSGFDLSHRSRIRRSLLSRLVASRYAGRHTNKGDFRMNTRVLKPATLFVAGILILVTVSAMTVPPVKAMARDLLQQIGQFILVDRSIEEQVPPTAAEAAQPTMEPPAFAPITVTSLAEAEKAAGFEVLELSSLPGDFKLTHRVVNALPDGIGVYTVYASSTGGMLTVTQAQYKAGAEPQEFWVGGTVVQEVVVRGQQGAWIKDLSMGVPVDEEGRAELVKLNALLWEEDGFTFLVTTNQLSLDEVVDAVNGLK